MTQDLKEWGYVVLYYILPDHVKALVPCPARANVSFV